MSLGGGSKKKVRRRAGEYILGVRIKRDTTHTTYHIQIIMYKLSLFLVPAVFIGLSFVSLVVLNILVSKQVAQCTPGCGIHFASKVKAKGQI